jgi:hypothetical protein
MKRYAIGGREFELRPLTLRQRQLAAPFWSKILTALKRVTEVKDDVSGLIDVSLELDTVLLGEDNAFARFLATILTPTDAEKWTERMIDENAPTMLEITEDVQAEVIQDFLLRQSASNVTSARSTQNSTSTNNHSMPNDNHNTTPGAP